MPALVIATVRGVGRRVVDAWEVNGLFVVDCDQVYTRRAKPWPVMIQQKSVRTGLLNRPLLNKAVDADSLRYPKQRHEQQHRFVDWHVGRSNVSSAQPTAHK